MPRMALRQASLWSALCIALVFPVAAQHRKPAKPATPPPTLPSVGADSLNNVKFRNLGPAVAGGRVAAVVGVPGDRDVYYIGAGGGGVWKTTNAPGSLVAG